MRIEIAISLAIVAIVAASVWALGQFGGSITGGVGEARAPIVREPDLVAAHAPAKPAAANPGSSLQSAKPKDAPATPPAATPATPAAPAGAVTPPKPLNNPFASNFAPGGEPVLTPQNVPAATAQPEQQAAAPSANPAPASPSAQPSGSSLASAMATTASIAEQFKMRKLTYNRPPAKLALNKPIDISLIIDSTGEANAAERIKDLPGTVVERDVGLSDFVSAELIGADFDIQLQTTAPRQKLSSKIANEWRWHVTPTAEGTHTLTLNVYGYATGSLDAEPLDSYRDDIVVEVQQLDALVSWAKGVQPLFAVLAALAGACSATFAVLRFREEKKRGKTPPPSAAA